MFASLISHPSVPVAVERPHFGFNHVQSPPDFGRPISLKHLYILMMTSCCFLAPVASVFANKNVKLLCFLVFFEWPHRESFMISWRKQWHQGFGPRRHILRSGQTWKRLHAAHELILGRLIQLCWEAQWPKNWPANSSNEKNINISIAQWVWSWSWFPIWILRSYFQSPTPKTEGLNSSSKVQLTLTILSHSAMGCWQSSGCIKHGDFEAKDISKSMKHWGFN